MSWLLPENASTFGAPFDNFAIFMLLICGLTTFFIFLTIFVFIVKYHRHTGPSEKFPKKDTGIFEWTWTLVPLSVFIFMFWWGTRVFLEIQSVPATGLPIFVLGKQWMWEFEHSSGQKEINELHLPIGRAVRLTMISQDTIHSFFVPAFRVKQDLLPGRYTYIWFTPTKVGKYRILCAELCGTNHSEMTGFVHVMTADEYALWLNRDADSGNLVELGEKVFERAQCIGCHTSNAPSLIGLYGRNGVDENSLMESILRPSAKITKGYKDIMPSYQGQFSERELKGLIEYIKTLREPTT